MIISEAGAEPGIPVGGFVVVGLLAAAFAGYGLALLTDFRGMRTGLSGRSSAVIERSRLTGNPVPPMTALFADYSRAFGGFMLGAGVFMGLVLALMAAGPGDS